MLNLLSSNFAFASLLCWCALLADCLNAQDEAFYPAPVVGSGTAGYQVADQPTEFDAVMARLERAEAALASLQQAQLQPGAGSLPPEARLSGFDYTSAYNNAYQQASKPAADAAKKDEKPKEKKWYDKLSLRGYAQVRINEVTREAPGSAPAQHVGDRSVGDNQSFLIRRARLIVSGDVSEHLAVYLQPDFANTPPSSPDATYFAVVRDWYADCFVDVEKVHRFRVGQSKLPYGWENMQSSSNRLPLDRSDGINSSVRNERDLGVFYYWTPEPAQEFFKEVIDSGLKGSGNYGVFGCGFYNGQGGSLLEQNDNLHFVARLTIPHQFENCQYMEVGIQGYTGKYTVLSSPISPLGVGPAITPLGTIGDNRDGLLDQRVAASFIWYPQPFGFQAEWNVGQGPSLNDAQTEVVVRSLTGGYAMVMYRYQSPCHGEFFPFARYAMYRGGYKQERNAPYSRVDEFAIGLEWQINKQLELVTEYTFTDRTNTVAMSSANTRSYDQFVGQLLRFQFQFSY